MRWRQLEGGDDPPSPCSPAELGFENLVSNKGCDWFQFLQALIWPSHFPISERTLTPRRRARSVQTATHTTDSAWFMYPSGRSNGQPAK